MHTRVARITESDFKELLDLFQEFALFEKLPHKMINSLEQMTKEKAFIDGFTMKDDKNNIIGYVTFFIAYYTWSGKSLYMDDLYVCPQYRGLGLGTNLINQAIAFAKENECNKMRWQVSSWNEAAIKFYKSIGAEIDDVENNCDLTF